MIMKMIVAIVNHLDVENVCDELKKNGYFITKIGSMGSFLHEGNSTLLIGTEERKVERALEIFRDVCGKRPIHVPGVSLYDDDSFEDDGDNKKPSPKRIIAGGATVFVLDVEQFEKM